MTCLDFRIYGCEDIHIRLFDQLRQEIANAAFGGPLRFVRPGAFRVVYASRHIDGVYINVLRHLTSPVAVVRKRLQDWTTAMLQSGYTAHENDYSFVRCYLMAAAVSIELHRSEQWKGDREACLSKDMSAETLVWLIGMDISVCFAVLLPRTTHIFACLGLIMVFLASPSTAKLRLIVLPLGWT
jgi:hypothetical protein